MNIAKPKRVTDRRYLRFVKEHDCLARTFMECAGPLDPHHVILVSLGGSDYTTVPLCRKHHDEAHRGLQAFENKYAILFNYEIAKLREEYRKLEVTTRAKPTREQKIKPYKKRALLRGYAVRTKDGLNWPFRYQSEAYDERKVLGEGKVVRVQIREEGIKR